jgi:hypothetical protein
VLSGEAANTNITVLLRYKKLKKKKKKWLVAEVVCNIELQPQGFRVLTKLFFSKEGHRVYWVQFLSENKSFVLII